MPYVKLEDGTKIWCIEKGTGMPVIFVHGSQCSSWFFKNQVDYLGQWYHAVAFDLPGHGQSDKPDKASYTLLELTTNLEQAITKLLGDNKIILAGHSMGGMIALIYATTPRFSKRLRGLVLMSTASTYRDPGFVDLIKKVEGGEIKVMDRKLWEPIQTFRFFTSKYAREHKDLLKELFDRMFETSEEVAAKTNRSMAYDYDVENKLDQVTVPTLIITGDKDSAVPPDRSKMLHERIKKSELRVLSPGIGHMLQYEATDKLNSELLNFLKKFS
jgi:pimeloyl-ACP methyl ester carboxylesterase